MIGFHIEMGWLALGPFTESTGERKSLQSLSYEDLQSSIFHSENKEGKLNKQKWVVHFRKDLIDKIPVKITMFFISSVVKTEPSLITVTNFLNILCAHTHTQISAQKLTYRQIHFFINPCDKTSCNYPLFLCFCFFM